MIGILLGQRAFTYHGILIRSLVNHASRACKIANHAHCDVRSLVTRIIWVQSRVTLQIVEPSRVTQIPFATLLILLFGPTQFSHLTSLFWHEADCTLHGHLGQKEQHDNPLKRWRIMTKKKNLSTSFKRGLFELSVVWLESLINCSNDLKSLIHREWLFSRTEVHCNIGWDGCGWLC